MKTRSFSLHPLTACLLPLLLACAKGALPAGPVKLSAQAALRSLVRSPRRPQASLIFSGSISGQVARARRSASATPPAASTGTGSPVRRAATSSGGSARG